MNLKERIIKLVNYKNLAVLLVVGVLLMVLGGGKAAEVPKVESVTVMPSAVDEEKLCDILESVEGAGEVKVFISYRDNGSETVLYDMQSSSGGGEYDLSLNVKTEGDSPYTVKRKPPEIQGILVTASGAQSKAVKMRLKESVRCATGVAPGRIHIEVMKSEK